MLKKSSNKLIISGMAIPTWLQIKPSYFVIDQTQLPIPNTRVLKCNIVWKMNIYTNNRDIYTNNRGPELWQTALKQAKILSVHQLKGYKNIESQTLIWKAWIMDSILFKVNGCTKKILVLKTSTSINLSVNRETFKTGQKREVLGERWTFPVLRPRKPEIVWVTFKSN